MTAFNQEQAIKDYTELSRRISVGAYSERSAEDHLNGTYPEDGVEESIDNLTELAAREGLEFCWEVSNGTWVLLPLSPETRAARYNAEMDERNAIARATVPKPWLPLHDGE
ncbi:MAG TPA: hypothetical protein DDW33_03370 [Ktedonobacter sp.]|jgi:hypothetical protein|nr:hypothetical protein [Ktedonobacter sp.]HAT44601.1 hypothetical protein [Ktedonobacter sp.]HBE24710.1 hypothetical protein [Ktedonobacter sp.]HCJ36429.1 hypothetical protein [Ktedonobacter sp.]HCP73548.1 hypothetical protein [Ktedonobacter sp.]